MASSSSSSRRCKNDPNFFCYICGEYVVKKQRSNITSFVKNVYRSYFGMKLGDQEKTWAPHSVCRSCVEKLRNWALGKCSCLPFGIPMVWREQQNHFDDCYFCMCNIAGYNRRNKSKIAYPNLKSAIRPVLHGENVPVPIPPLDLDVNASSDSEPDLGCQDKDADFSIGEKGPELINQTELNDLVRDLGLTKGNAEILGSRLKEKNLLTSETIFTCYRNREKEFLSFFTNDDSLVYCNDISNLIHQLGDIPYDPEDWRLFIDSSKRSLKAVLLHNGNHLSSIPVAHSIYMKETYETMEILLRKIKYNVHNWAICGDLKVIAILLGQQGGYTKFPCFLCEWDSRKRDLHWVQKRWPPRNALIPGTKNIIAQNLVNPEKILLPPLHIKLGLMKQFVKALDKSGQCFQYLVSQFPSLSSAKIKEGIFDGTQIRKLTQDHKFEQHMTDVEKEAWNGFKNVINNFLGNTRSPNYKEIVDDMLQNFQLLGCNMSIKLHFLYSHLGYFPENLGAMSEEPGERFHQDIKEMERRYQGRWDKHMMADFCWCLKRETDVSGHKRKSLRKTFLAPRKQLKLL